MSPKIFTIWDFPEGTRIKIEKQEEFLRECIAISGSIRNLSKLLNKSPEVISGWIKNNLFIPLPSMKKLTALLNIKQEIIEQRIIAYKGPNSSNPIFNPILPIKESPELYAIMTHLICDGCVNKNKIPSYINLSKSLRKDFIKSLQIFGEIKIKEYYSKNGVSSFNFQKIIPDMLFKWYDIQFYSNSGYLPSEIFTLPDEFKYKVLAAAIDDEGSIKDSYIIISMKSEKFVLQLKQLFEDIFGKDAVCPLRKNGDCYAFSTRSFILEDFNSKIKLTHSHKKEAILWGLKKQKFSKRLKNKDRGNQLIYLLKTKSFLTNELSNKVLINNNNTLIQLKRLEKNYLVARTKEKYSHRWYITPLGNQYLKNIGGT